MAPINEVICAFCRLVHAIALLELVYSSTCANLLLFSRIERMTLAANFNFNNVSFYCRSTYEFISARASNCDIMIIRLNIIFHLVSPRI